MKPARPAQKPSPVRRQSPMEASHRAVPEERAATAAKAAAAEVVEHSHQEQIARPPGPAEEAAARTSRPSRIS